MCELSKLLDATVNRLLHPNDMIPISFGCWYIFLVYLKQKIFDKCNIASMTANNSFFRIVMQERYKFIYEEVVNIPQVQAMLNNPTQRDHYITFVMQIIYDTQNAEMQAVIDSIKGIQQTSIKGPYPQLIQAMDAAIAALNEVALNTQLISGEHEDIAQRFILVQKALPLYAGPKH